MLRNFADRFVLAQKYHKWDILSSMTWEEIRARYAALLVASGATQHAVAAAGGLSGQNAISKLVANTKRGPSVETFIRAVQGLGIPLSTFFAALETPAPDPRASAPPPLGRSPHESSASTTPGNVVNITLFDEQRITAIVQAIFDRVHQRMAECGAPRAMGSRIDKGRQCDCAASQAGTRTG
jgi:transcriptional regulator with XRE-family HTH domain